MRRKSENLRQSPSPQHPPLYLAEFQDSSNPPLDTTLIMKKTQYSFLKRKSININARIAKTISESRNVVNMARKLLGEREDLHLRQASPSSSRKASEHETKPNSRSISPYKDARCGNMAQLRRIAGSLSPMGRRYAGRNHNLATKTLALDRCIWDNEKNEEMSRIRSGSDVSEVGYGAMAQEKAAKWGSSQHIGKTKMYSIFGRKAKREPSNEPKYTRDSLERLAMNDMRLYAESEQEFMNEYAVNMVGALLLQTDGGSKYRKPVDFGCAPLGKKL